MSCPSYYAPIQKSISSTECHVNDKKIQARRHEKRFYIFLPNKYALFREAQVKYNIIAASAIYSSGTTASRASVVQPHATTGSTSGAGSIGLIYKSVAKIRSTKTPTQNIY